MGECLVDIELAKKAGYPAHLQPKLDKRKIECLQRIEEAAKPIVDCLKLSYDQDEQIPCIANVLNSDRNANGECVALAREDIDVVCITMKKTVMKLMRYYKLMCNISSFSNIVNKFQMKFLFQNEPNLSSTFTGLK